MNLTVVLSFILGLGLTLIYTKQIIKKERESLLEFKNSDEYKNIIELTFEKGVNEGKQQVFNSKEYEVALENQFMKGLKEGEESTLKKITIEYNPFIEVKETFFKKSAKSGYSMQLFFSGFPLGDSMTRILKIEEKFKDENMKYMVENVSNVLNNILLTVDPLGILVRVNKPEVKKSKEE